jgi:hypothetical protein
MYERAQAQQQADEPTANGASSSNGAGATSDDEEVVDAEVVDEQK